MIQREFFPGDKWMYLKIYCPPVISDRIISEVIHPAVRSMSRKGLIRTWFFIRYSDPNYHLRFRVLLNDPRNLWETLDAINVRLKPFIRDRMVNSVISDVYSREIERYGAKVMSDTEYIFSADSETVVTVISAAGVDKWKYSFPLVDSFMDAAGYNTTMKYELMEQICKGFMTEFGHSSDSEHSFSLAYRRQRKLVEEFISLAAISDRQIQKSFKKRGEIIGNLIKDPENYNIRSIIHMSLNRLFTTDNRRAEYVTCDFLRRYYKSALKRK